MSQLCSVASCRFLAAHKFPKNPDVRKKWLDAIRRPDYVPKASSGLCYSHFRPSDYLVESREGGFRLKTRRLITGAVPSLFDWNDGNDRECGDINQPVQEDRRLLHGRGEVEDNGIEALTDSDPDQPAKKKRRVVEEEDSGDWNDRRECHCCLCKWNVQ